MRSTDGNPTAAPPTASWSNGSNEGRFAAADNHSRPTRKEKPQEGKVPRGGKGTVNEDGKKDAHGVQGGGCVCAVRSIRREVRWTGKSTCSEGGGVLGILAP